METRMQARVREIRNEMKNATKGNGKDVNELKPLQP